jgi:hypothetical protein
MLRAVNAGGSRGGALTFRGAPLTAMRWDAPRPRSLAWIPERPPAFAGGAGEGKSFRRDRVAVAARSPDAAGAGTSDGPGVWVAAARALSPVSVAVDACGQMGRLIGKGGECVRRMCAETGCSMRKDETGLDEMVVEGPTPTRVRAGVERVRVEISRWIGDERAGSAPGRPHRASDRPGGGFVDIPPVRLPRALELELDPLRDPIGGRGPSGRASPASSARDEAGESADDFSENDASLDRPNSMDRHDDLNDIIDELRGSPRDDLPEALGTPGRGATAEGRSNSVAFLDGVPGGFKKRLETDRAAGPRGSLAAAADTAVVPVVTVARESPFAPSASKEETPRAPSLPRSLPRSFPEREERATEIATVSTEIVPPATRDGAVAVPSREQIPAPALEVPIPAPALEVPSEPLSSPGDRLRALIADRQIPRDSLQRCVSRRSGPGGSAAGEGEAFAAEHAAKTLGDALRNLFVRHRVSKRAAPSGYRCGRVVAVRAPSTSASEAGGSTTRVADSDWTLELDVDSKPDAKRGAARCSTSASLVSNVACAVCEIQEWVARCFRGDEAAALAAMEAEAVNPGTARKRVAAGVTDGDAKRARASDRR